MSDINNIPTELLLAIFFCVPPRSLFRCLRYVCKTWCRLIDDPSFIKTHTEYWIQNSSNMHLLYLDVSLEETDDEIELETTNSSDYNDTHPLFFSYLNLFNYDEYIIKFEKNDIDLDTTSMMTGMFRTFNICNGLISIHTYDDTSFSNHWTVRNPLTREVHDLPWNDDLDVEYNAYATGFGYNYADDDYKIVFHRSFVDDNGVEKFETLIYSMKLDSWKKKIIINYGDSFFISDWNKGVFCNRALHWIGVQFTEEVIVVFDLESEDFRFLTMPDSFKALDRYPLNMELGELGGSLYLSLMDESQIWLLSENSWSLLFSEKLKYCWLRPITYSTNKEFLLLQKNHDHLKDLFDLSTNLEYELVDLKNNTTNQTFKFPWKLYSTQIFRPSLVRITKPSKEEATRIEESRAGAEPQTFPD